MLKNLPNFNKKMIWGGFFYTSHRVLGNFLTKKKKCRKMVDSFAKKAQNLNNKKTSKGDERYEHETNC